MRAQWWHALVLIAIGIALDYWFPGFANATLGKLTARKS